MCHHKHLSNLQLGCKKPRRDKNEDKKTLKNKKEAEKVEKKLREKPREL